MVKAEAVAALAIITAEDAAGKATKKFYRMDKALTAGLSDLCRTIRQEGENKAHGILYREPVEETRALVDLASKMQRQQRRIRELDEIVRTLKGGFDG